MSNKVNLLLILKKLFNRQNFTSRDLKKKDILDSLQMITLIEYLAKNYKFDSKNFNKKYKNLNIQNLNLFLNKD